MRRSGLDSRSAAAATAVVSILILALGSAPAASADREKLHLRNELGIVEAKSGHLEDALRQFSLVLAETPNEPAALNNSANIYFLGGETERACELYQRAIAVAPRDGGVHLNLGLALHASGDAEQAMAHVREGLLLVGDLQHAYFLLGLAPPPQEDSPAAAGDSAAAGAAGSAAAATARAADEAGLRTVEIEALLARALAKVPRPDSTAARLAERGQVASRPAGAKAAQPETSPHQLYWMPMAMEP